MKKMLLMALLGLGFVMGTESRALAWCKWSWGCGINCAYEGGGNCILWGAIKGAQVPYAGMVDGGVPVGPGPVMPGPMHGGVPGSPVVPPANPPIMPRAEAQRVGYAEANSYQAEPQYQTPSYAVPSYWYDR